MGLAVSTPLRGVLPSLAASEESLLPTALDTCCRAGCATPVASCTPMDPARGLVGSWIVGVPADADDSP